MSMLMQKYNQNIPFRIICSYLFFLLQKTKQKSSNFNLNLMIRFDQSLARQSDTNFKDTFLEIFLIFPTILAVAA